MPIRLFQPPNYNGPHGWTTDISVWRDGNQAAGPEGMSLALVTLPLRIA